MKKLVYILFFLPLIGVAQLDYETRSLTISAVELPVADLPSLDELLNSSFYKSNSIFSGKFRSFGMNSDNYRHEVSMEEVLAYKENNFIDPKINLGPSIPQKEFGFSVTVSGSNSFDGTSSSNGIRNTVYKEMRPVFFCQRTGLNLLNQ